jgi:hypothetical protein
MLTYAPHRARWSSPVQQQVQQQRRVPAFAPDTQDEVRSSFERRPSSMIALPRRLLHHRDIPDTEAIVLPG